MRQAVRDAFVSFTEKFEGDVNCMYADVKGLITVGVGNLIDPVGMALDLPFLRVSDNAPASRQEIGQEWRMMKTTPGLATAGWKAAKEIARLYLSPEGISKLVSDKLLCNEHYLVAMKGRFPEFSNWCADAQLGILSMAWALGPAFSFPRFEMAVHAKDWMTASVQCHMDASHNAGLTPRNSADHTLFANAASSTDPDRLYYPEVL